MSNTNEPEKNNEQCPFCKSEVPAGATVCAGCQAFQDTVETPHPDARKYDRLAIAIIWITFIITAVGMANNIEDFPYAITIIGVIISFVIGWHGKQLKSTKELKWLRRHAR